MNTRETEKTPFFTLRYEGLVCLFLVIVSLAVYWQVGNHTFIDYDDNAYVTENRHVQSGLTPKSITWAFTTTHASNWHPLTWLSHMLDCQIYGLNPGGHHFTNVIFHILNSILMFLIFRRMTGALWKSAFVAAFFAIHPLHVESVAWVAERKDVLSTFFWMLTMGSYVWYVERPGTSRYLLAILFFALGLMAKPMLVTLPFVLLLLDYWPLGRFQVRKLDVAQRTEEKTQKDTKSKKKKSPRHTLKNAVQENKIITSDYQWSLVVPFIWEKIPFFVLAAASSVVTFFVQQSGGAVRSFDVLPLTVRVSNALVAYVSYIGKVFWPFNLAVLYPHYGMLEGWKVAGACLLLVFISFIVIRTVRWYPYLTIGWLWYLGTLVPVIGLVQVGIQSMADRYTYVPLIGLFVMITWGVSDLAGRWHYRYRKEGVAIVSAILLSILIVVTWFQLRHWTNSITLFKHAINVTDNNSVAHNNLGIALAERGKIDEAIDHYTRALKIKPDYAKAHYNLGNALGKQGRKAEAIDHYTKALKIKPDYVKAHYNLGVVLAEKEKKYDRALFHFRESLRFKPEYPDALMNIGTIFVKRGDVNMAIDYFLKTLRIQPDNLRAHLNLGSVFLQEGETDKAISHFRESLRIDSNHPEANYCLGLVLAKCGDIDEAIKYFSKTLRLTPKNARALNSLGIALLRKEKIVDAIVHFREAVRVKPDFTEARGNLKVALADLKKTDEDIKKLQESLKVNPGDSGLCYDLGNLYYKKGELDKAIYQYQKSLSIQPNAVQVLNNLAIVYITKKEYGKAVSIFSRIAELQPDNADIYYNIACMYSIQNKVEKSIDSLKNAIKKGYDNWDLIKTDKDLENVRSSLYYKILMSSR